MAVSLKKINRILLGVFFTLAGINHFVNPQFYLPLIPPYLQYPGMINILSGFFEILFGFGVLYPPTRKISAIGIIMMLIAFIPAHIYFVKIDSCVPDGLCVPAWIGWIRLVVIHPLLIYWVWVTGNSFTPPSRR